MEEVDEDGDREEEADEAEDGGSGSGEEEEADKAEGGGSGNREEEEADEAEGGGSGNGDEQESNRAVDEDIHTIIAPTSDEIHLLEEIMGGHGLVEEDHCDVVVDGWMRSLEIEKKKIWFEKLYNADVDGRKMVHEVIVVKKKGRGKEKVDEQNVHVMELVEGGLKEFCEKMTTL
ncbi:hypothetical protein AALP_AAs73735U000500 [Arabis alpina]|uniref:DUF287 domain-containing protein n=1 Tax=Arabis alpina TaxID=50452 RepID=A0A087FWG8_ARAAL|nr:hypothetical protein AALP_AAs73735U000500 [Arabis alpina]